MKRCRSVVVLLIMTSLLGGCALIGCGGSATNGLVLGTCEMHTNF
jgi:hypothetical protein